MKNQVTLAIDYLGISSATLCLVHCLLFPLLTFIPIGISHNHYIDLFFALIGLFAVVKILKTTTKKHIKIILSVSMIFIFGSVISTIFFHYHSVLLYFGGFGMIVGHCLNFTSHKR
ncbi:MAG: MerC mercury resistance protein [Flavobacteriales bacterium]|nr:MAG: MerC mercury resistance protein [Flavobacteriales bacterium]